MDGSRFPNNLTSLYSIRTILWFWRTDVHKVLGRMLSFSSLTFQVFVIIQGVKICVSFEL